MEDRIRFSISLFHEVAGISLFLFDERLELVEAQSEWASPMRNFFLLNCGIDLTKVLEATDSRPLLIKDSLHLNWVVLPLVGKQSFLLLGPTMESSFTNRTFQKTAEFQTMTVSSKISFLKMVRDIPVIALNQFAAYGEILHYLIYGKKASIQILLGQTSAKKAIVEDKRIRNIPDSHGTQFYELQMLRNVREGIFSERIPSISSGVTPGMLAPDNPLRQSQDLIIVLIALVSRAAVEGGMDFEASFTLSDSLIQQIELASSVSEVAKIAGEATRIYTEEVQKILHQNYSAMTRLACTYLDKHLLADFCLDDLAKELGYDKYYISRIFHTEVGMTIQEYLTRKKIDRAKDLLISTSQTVQEISDFLHFHSQSYFSKQFKRVTGVSPLAWRKECKNIKSPRQDSPGERSK